jgi:hypothetical protein
MFGQGESSNFIANEMSAFSLSLEKSVLAEESVKNSNKSHW